MEYTLDTLPAVCTLEDLSQILKIHPRTLRRLRSQGRLPFQPIPNLGKLVRYSGKSIHDFLLTNGFQGKKKFNG